MAFDLLNMFLNSQRTPQESQYMTMQPSKTEEGAELNKMLLEMSRLSVGQSVTGEVVSLKGNEVTLLVKNEMLMNARLDVNMILNKGQTLTFEVKSNQDGQLALRPLFSNTLQEQNAVKALDAANLPVQEKTLFMVDQLMEQGMSVNKEMLTNVFRESNMFPDADLKDIIMLHKMNIPVTPESIGKMSLYQNNNQEMLPQLSSMSEELVSLLKDMQQNGSTEKTTLFLNQLLDSIGKSVNEIAINEVPINEVPVNQENESIASNTEQNILDLSGEKNGKEMRTVLKEQILQDAKLLMEEPDIQKKLTIKERVVKNLHTFFKNNFLMEPKDISKENYVKNYYEKLSDRLDELEHIVKDNGKLESSFGKTVNQVRSNVNFMNQINEIYHYIQLPVKMNDRQASGDLYVYKRKTAKADDDGNLTALLHLSMQTLGNMDIFLSLKDEKLNTKFCMEKEEMIDFIEAHIGQLNERLTKKGYQIYTAVTGKEKEDRTVIDNIVAGNSGVSVLSKQSFDAFV